jgi:integrase
MSSANRSWAMSLITPRTSSPAESVIFTRLLEKAGLRHVRIHDLRHTFASLLLQQGESIVYVKEQLGHASIQVTVDTYGHLIPGANRIAMDGLDDAPTQPDATPRNHDHRSRVMANNLSALE